MRPTRGSSSTSSSTASVTLIRTEWMWLRSTTGMGLGRDGPQVGRLEVVDVTPASRSGASSRNRSSRPAVRG